MPVCLLRRARERARLRARMRSAAIVFVTSVMQPATGSGGLGGGHIAIWSGRICAPRGGHRAPQTAAGPEAQAGPRGEPRPALTPLREALDEQRLAHAAGDAHRLDAELPLEHVEAVGEGRHQPGADYPLRVAAVRD